MGRVTTANDKLSPYYSRNASGGVDETKAPGPYSSVFFQTTKKDPKKKKKRRDVIRFDVTPGHFQKKYFVHQLLTTGRESKRPAAQNTHMSRILPSLIHAGKIKLFGCRPITFITNVRRCDRLCRKTIQAEDDPRSAHQINSCWCDYNSSFFWHSPTEIGMLYPAQCFPFFPLTKK